MDELTQCALGAQRGDRDALARFVRVAQPDVWRLCAHLVSREVADDLTQDTFVRAIGALRAFRAESTARTWVLSIARRACADHLRKLTRWRRLAGRAGPADLSQPPDRRERSDGRDGPGEPVDQADHAEHADVRTLIDALPLERRLAFVLTQVLGLSYEEAANVCECPVGTIRSRLSRAREQLVASLQADERTTIGDRRTVADDGRG